MTLPPVADGDGSPSGRSAKRKRELAQAQPMEASPDAADSAAAAAGGQQPAVIEANGTSEHNGAQQLRPIAPQETSRPHYLGIVLQEETRLLGVGALANK